MPLLSRLRVSENGRFLITETGKPFFWLGDTAWELFHRLTEEDARLYLANRKKNRFTVIQAVILAELDGLNTPNPYGERPFINNNPTQPNEAYFAYVDKVITMAADLGLYMAVLPTWGDKVTPLWGKGPVIFNQETAYIYGQFLGKRYKNYSNIVWMLGGDRPPVHENIFNF